MPLIRMSISVTAALCISIAAASAADFRAVVAETIVDRPASLVWERVGSFCALREWAKTPCEYASGSGDIGTVRNVNNQVLEAMVAKTQYSYTYINISRLSPTMQHMTLEAMPLEGQRTRLSYTMVYELSAPDGTDRDRLIQRFKEILANMKTIAEAK